mmetsp:Transcript_62595/g.117085  ORF Transcript_62595/g.117085 Transcript_62595/m.117085 type:complete len:156 (+) Transcript_62595:52-519(+)
MPKFVVSKKGDNPFALPKRKKRHAQGDPEANYNCKEEARAREAEAKAAKAQRRAEEAARPPGKKALKRQARRMKMTEEGRIQKTDKELAQLLKCEDDVVCAFADVQDEAELRNKFPGQGTSGVGSEYFRASCYRFRFLLSSDGSPVAQIYKWPWP